MDLADGAMVPPEAGGWQAEVLCLRRGMHAEAGISCGNSKRWTSLACRAAEVRLLGQDKENMGVMSYNEAMDKAIAEDLDLVLISADASPPVCRIMDASKHKYELEKADKESKKKQREAR